jgi:hypothetical protein
MNEERGGVATAVWAPSQPSVAVETNLPDYDEYEVRELACPQYNVQNVRIHIDFGAARRILKRTF